jgi:alkaline phosphatase D
MPNAMTLQILGATTLWAASGVAASYHNNLAYVSPSRRHESLAVPVSQVKKRQSGNLYDASELEFTHGIASGDPYSDSVIIWTRLAPTSENTASDTVPGGVVPIYDNPEAAPPSQKAACVEFKISTDSALISIVDQGYAYTTSDVDYTVKVRNGLHCHFFF